MDPFLLTVIAGLVLLVVAPVALTILKLAKTVSLPWRKVLVACIASTAVGYLILDFATRHAP